MNEDKNGVVFRTPADGHVQPGATAPRTELREIDPESGRGEDWMTTEGRHIMAVTASVDAIPSTSKMEVVGQVHDVGPYVLLIQLTGEKLYIKAGDLRVTLIEPYELGTVFAYKFIVENGEIQVWFNDELKATYPAECVGCYFKIGSYLQAPPEPGNPEFGQTTVYSLNVTHEE